MSFELITKIEDLLTELKTKLSPAAKVVVTDAEEIGSATLNYIKKNGLQDLYQIASVLLTSISAGTPWGEVLTAVVAQGTADGIQIAKGAESIVLAQAQADLIAGGRLIAPIATASTSAPVA